MLRPMGRVRIGTCSWADEALSKHFYPPGTPAGERLPYYAQQFDTVEVDSTYYRLPAEEQVARWAERTPEGFVMHVKAYGLMTRHPVAAKTLPPDLREQMPVDEKGRVDRPPRELRGEVFRRFLDALEPEPAPGREDPRRGARVEWPREAPRDHPRRRRPLGHLRRGGGGARALA